MTLSLLRIPIYGTKKNEQLYHLVEVLIQGNGSFYGNHGKLKIILLVSCRIEQNVTAMYEYLNVGIDNTCILYQRRLDIACSNT